MDESLDALANLISALSEKPYDVSLHSQHIRFTQSTEGMEAELVSACEMMTNFLAASDEVWLPIINAKRETLDLNTSEGVEELIALYARAETDYLSIPLLQKHLQFLVEQHSSYFSGEQDRTDALGSIFTTEWTRDAIGEVVKKGIGHLTQSHLLWDVQRDWELQVLEATPASERKQLVDHVQLLHLNRLRQPHSNSEDTAQSYSSFTTNYKPPQEYESLLVSASKMRSQAKKSFERRENSETILAQSNYSLESYAQYIAAERRAKYQDLFVQQTLFERAIAEAAKRRFNGEQGAEEALQSFWTGYCDILRINGVEGSVQHNVLKRAVRSVPSSGEIWARYIRFLERVADSHEMTEDRESVAAADVYARAISTNLLQSDVEQIVPVVLARAGYEKRKIEAGTADEEGFSTLIGTVQNGIDMVHKASPNGDSRFRLEKYLSEIYLRLAELPDEAIAIWKNATKNYKSSYLAWTSYTDVLTKQDKLDQVRSIYKDLCMKNLDWPEAIWEAWVTFEHLYGSVEEIEFCMDKIEKAQYQVNARRAKEAARATYQAMQVTMDNQATNADAVQAENGPSDAAMDVDTSVHRENIGKRKAEESPAPEATKKARTEPKPPPLKRDRENCTVFVADLPSAVAEDDLSNLFKDCGRIREIKITPLANFLVATVEFFERESVPMALTKDKKRLHDQEVSVHLAWKSTLYVTNFPESSDDTSVRELFGKYGLIFDVRWPSKKFKNTRRFCYVQYTSPTAAETALQLHGQELESGLPLNVFISNPERRKERTDQDANDREVYVAGLSKFTTKADLEKLFGMYGPVKEVRMATNDDGSSKGFAFIEFQEEKDAQASLAANNYELKKRRIAVTLADSRVRARSNKASDTGFGKHTDAKNRSVRVRNLPPGTQEGLLQQLFEKFSAVRRVEVFTQQNEAVVELATPSEASKLLLRTEPLVFQDNVLELAEEVAAAGRTLPPKAGGMFIPRSAASRPRAGLGHARAPKNVVKNLAVLAATSPSSESQTTNDSSQRSQPNQGKQQDDFRKMLEGK